MGTRSLEVVADRFAKTAGAWVDLALAEEVRLDLSEAPPRPGLVPWLERAAALFGVRHPHLAQVVDYGMVGHAQVFQALRLPAAVRPWKARDVLTARALWSAVNFLHRQGLSAGRLAWNRVVKVGHDPVLLPDAMTGRPLRVDTSGAQVSRQVLWVAARTEVAQLARLLGPRTPRGMLARGGGRPPHGPLAAMTAAVLGVSHEINQIIELLECGRNGEPRQVQLRARPGPALAVAVQVVAREARLRGFIPLSTACLSAQRGRPPVLTDDDLGRLARDRHILIIHWPLAGAGIPAKPAVRLLLELGIASSRPHLLLGINTEHTGAEPEMRLTLPGQETGIGHMHVVPVCRLAEPGEATSGDAKVTARASESQLTYGATDAPGADAPGQVVVTTDPAVTPGRGQARNAEDHLRAAVARARRRADEGLRLARRGRHAAGERLLRDAAGALERRGDDAWAGRTALDLGRVLHWRGRVREAARAFEQARACFDRCGLSVASIRAAVYLGLVWTDTGRLCDAEAALRAASMAATEMGSADAQAFAGLGLARCLLWQRRWEEARRILAAGAAPDRVSEATQDGQRPQADGRDGRLPRQEAGRGCRESPECWVWDQDLDPSVMKACLESRIALGLRDLLAAGLSARRAGEQARRGGEARDLAAARTAAARVHAEIADIEGLRHHVSEGLHAAARAHAPLQAVQLRLLLIDGLRRAGCCCEADRLAARLARTIRDSLPVLLRRRVEAVVRGGLSSGILTTLTPVSAAPADAGRCVSGPVAPSQDRGEVVEEIVELLRTCHEVVDEGTLLERVAGYLRQQARASSVAFFGLEASGMPSVAVSGCRPFPAETAKRAVETGLFIAPGDMLGRAEAGVPVRYAGATVGALACRWPIDVWLDQDRIRVLLSTAATLAAPGVRTALDRRASPAAVEAAEPELMGLGDSMTELRAAIARAARTPFPVLIEGESGSGKELVARAIHRLSARRDRKYCTLNCAALTDELLEAELFGHARGAFTGAVGERTGLFEEADGGTLVLDEVRELSPRAQAKLLRVLQEGEVRRVGENVTRWVDVRIVAATNRALQDEVAAGRFRRDLFYRLNVIRVTVPPLRDRPEDIPVLANHFWVQAVARTGSRATLAPATMAVLARNDWPGNVRELQNVMTALAVSAPRRGSVGPTSLPGALAALSASPQATTLGEARRMFEERYVRAALARAGGHRGHTARDLGLSRQGLAKMLARLNVDTARPRPG